MKSWITVALFLFVSPLAFAGPCADAYNKAVDNNSIFKFDDKGNVQVSENQKSKVVINEKKDKTHKMVVNIKGNRVTYLIRFADGKVSSIDSGPKRSVSFRGECQEQEAMDENARTKLDAVEMDNAERLKSAH